MPRRREPDSEEALRAGLSALDRLLEHRVRLAVCVVLSNADALSFRRLKELTGETDGSLGAHLRKLENAGYVRVKKDYQDRRPITWYALAAKGRRALGAHLEALQSLLGSAGTEG